MARSEFPVKVRKDAWLRCKGFCERCGAKLQVGKFQYDHDIPDALGGSNTLDNCVVLCSACHLPKTTQIDIPRISKGKRQQFKLVAGIRSSSNRPIQSAGFAQIDMKYSKARRCWVNKDTGERTDPPPGFGENGRRL